MSLLKNTLSTALRVLSVRLQPLVPQSESCYRRALQTSLIKNQNICNRFTKHVLPISSSGFHTSSRRHDLSEFLDDEKHWAEETVKVGRPWRREELRIKSNEDLHKLWYVLLKERNMLLTMEAEYTRRSELFPSPERVFKVEESMENLQEVIKERDIAFNLLETGHTGLQEGAYVRNFLGLKTYRVFKEHAIPRFMNKTYNLLHPPYRKSMVKYIALYKEQQRIKQRKEKKKFIRRQKRLEEVFPEMKKMQN